MIRRIWNRMTDGESAASGLVVISSIVLSMVVLTVGVVA
jgi:hypothetical protein